jgi:hypothetical protein
MSDVVFYEVSRGGKNPLYYSLDLEDNGCYVWLSGLERWVPSIAGSAEDFLMAFDHDTGKMDGDMGLDVRQVYLREAMILA